MNKEQTLAGLDKLLNELEYLINEGSESWFNQADANLKRFLVSVAIHDVKNGKSLVASLQDAMKCFDNCVEEVVQLVKESQG